MKIDPPPLRRWLLWHHALMTLPYWQRDRRTIAHHEAAHAVIGLFLEMPLVRVELIEKDDRRGQALFDMAAMEAPAAAAKEAAPNAPVSAEIFEVVAAAHAAWSYAGVMAEMLLHGIPLSGRVETSTKDWRTARVMLSIGFGDDRAECAIFYAQYLARHILQLNWDLVTAIADEVEKKGQVSGDNVMRICAGRSVSWGELTDKW